MTYKICVIKGDGIGPEVVDSAVKVLKALPLKFEFSEAKAGYDCYKECKTSIPDETIEACKHKECIQELKELRKTIQAK